MAIQSSMGAHKLDVRYGDRNTIPYYNGILNPALFADALAFAAITAGSVYSLTTAGFLVPGLVNASTPSTVGGVIPYFGWSGLDVNNYPDSLRTRGMPNFGNTPNPAPGGIAFIPATTQVVLNAGGTAVLSVTVTNGGLNYISAPTVAFTAPASGTITATATVVNGVVTAITIGTNTAVYTAGTVVVATLTGGSNLSSGPFPFQGVPVNNTGIPAGPFATIQHKMAGELSTTEFNTAAAYAPGAALTAVRAYAAGSGTGLSGKLRPVAAGTDIIVGYVAPAGSFMGVEGYPVLAFTPAFVPGSTAPADFT